MGGLAARYKGKDVKLIVKYRVRSFSFPGSTLVFGIFFSRTNVGNYLHTFVLEKENATHRGRPRKAKRTHPVKIPRFKHV